MGWYSWLEHEIPLQYQFQVTPNVFFITYWLKFRVGYTDKNFFLFDMFLGVYQYQMLMVFTLLTKI